MNTPLKFFFSLVLANNNPPLNIYCENIIVTFLSFKFYSLFYFSLYLFFFRPHVIYIFFPLFFYSTHVFFTFLPCLYFSPFFILFFFTKLLLFCPLSFQNVPFLFSLSLLSFYTFSYTTHSHALLHLDLLYSFLFL